MRYVMYLSMSSMRPLSVRALVLPLTGRMAYCWPMISCCKSSRRATCLACEGFGLRSLRGARRAVLPALANRPPPLRTVWCSRPTSATTARLVPGDGGAGAVWEWLVTISLERVRRPRPSATQRQKAAGVSCLGGWAQHHTVFLP